MSDRAISSRPVSVRRGSIRALAGLDPAFRQIVAGLRNARGWDETLDLRLLQAFWPKIAGPTLANNTSVVALHGSRVVIRVPDETWKAQLEALRPVLLGKINEPWPGRPVRELRFVYEDYAR
jgi:predicted nucleic acid-binding Zn ribbon protein